MRHLHNYKNFNEKFNLSLTDDPSVTAAKKNYNDLELALQQYKMNATKLENIYTAINRKDNTLLYDDVTLKKEVEKIIGNTEELEEESFFSKYLALLSIKRDIIRKQKTQSLDDETLKGLKTSQEASDSKEEDPRIAETEERMSLNQSDISELQKKLLKDQKDFNDMMIKKTIEFKNSAI